MRGCRAHLSVSWRLRRKRGGIGLKHCRCLFLRRFCIQSMYLPKSPRSIHFAFKVMTIRAGATARLPAFSSARRRHRARSTNAWLTPGIRPAPTRWRHLRRDRRASMVRFRSDRLRDDQDPWSRPPDRANTPSQMAAPGVSLVARPGLAHRLNVNQSSSHLNVQVH